MQSLEKSYPKILLLYINSPQHHNANNFKIYPLKKRMLSITKPTFKSLSSLCKVEYMGRLGPMQKIIMLCGPPGAGKGTYASMLARDFGYAKISTGDEIRKILNGSTAAKYSPKVLSQLKRL